MTDSQNLPYEVYRLKLKLLVYGLKLTEDFYKDIENRNLNFSLGRKGGAGPAGGRYFIFKNNSVVNVPLLGSATKNSVLELRKLLEPDEDEESDDNLGGYNASKKKPVYYYTLIKDVQINKEFSDIRLVPSPTQYNDMDNLDNLKNRQIALIHGTSCLASTIIQTCKYWTNGTKCKFCGIQHSLKDNQTTKIKTPEQLLKALKDAVKVSNVSHVTLTSGTKETEDKGAYDYIEIVEKMKSEVPDIPIHIQIEPLESKDLYKQLKEAGTDTIGIHIETLDENLRKEITPGKSVITYPEYVNAWKEAVKVFGREQVSTFILIGLGEDLQETIEKIEEIIKIGVIPFLVPVRDFPGTDFKPVFNKFNDIVELHEKTAKLMIKYGLNPHNNKAGCVRCSGCSAIADTYDYIQSIS